MTPPTGTVYFCKLIGPRPTFPMDMTPAEAEVMHQHVAYWQGLMARGIAFAFGPVMDPSGPFGMCVVRVRDEAELNAIEAADPVMVAKLGFRQEHYLMPKAIVRE